MRYALQPNPFLSLLVTTSTVVALCCGSSSCSKPLVRISTAGGNFDVTIPSPFERRPADSEQSVLQGAPSAAGSAPVAQTAAVASSIIGAEYPLDRWSPGEVEARLRQNQREFDQLVGSRTKLLATRYWEQPASGDVADFFSSDELFALHRLDIELMQLWGLLDTHNARAVLIKRIDGLERDVERMERDGVDVRGQTRGRAKLKDELRPLLDRVNKVMLAGSMGKPPIGTAQAASIPLPFGLIIGSGREAATDPSGGNPADPIRVLARSVRRLDEDFRLGAVRGLILWPSVIGATQIGDAHLKPEARRRILASQAAGAAATYSKWLASARSEQHAYFRDCMEFCKQIEALARAGDDRGVDAARQSWVQAAVGRLLEPMTTDPSAGKKAEQIAGRAASTTSQGQGFQDIKTGSEPVTTDPSADKKSEQIAERAASTTSQGSGFQDFKGGVAEVIDLDSLSEQFLLARREAATKRYGEYAAVQPLTVDTARKMRSMAAQASLACNLVYRFRSRGEEKARLASLQQEARVEAELGISPEQQRGSDRAREEKRLTEKLAKERYWVVSVTCNDFARGATWIEWTRACWSSPNRDTESLRGIWDTEICNCLTGVDAAGGRTMKWIVTALQDEAKRRYGAEPEVSKWLVEESKFYENLSKDFDALRKLKSPPETAQYRDAARRIDDALRARRNSIFAGFFDPLPDAASQK